MRVGSLFAGIGGFELAATWAGHDPVWSNELDSYACNVLRKNFNHEIIQKDIREIGKHNLEPVDIITGGFPCQPFSGAGSQKGREDDRYLWPEMFRVVRELGPPYVLCENVAGLVSMENGKILEGILNDLEDEGYRTESFVVPACAVEGWHRRDRIWIIAYSRSIGSDLVQYKPKKSSVGTSLQSFARVSTYGDRHKILARNSRDVNGLPEEMDRLKGLGNAIVPHVALEFFKILPHATTH